MKKLWLFALPLSVMASDLKDIVQKVQNSEMIQSIDFAVQAQQKGRDAVVANYLPKVEASYMYQYIHEDHRGPFDPMQSGNIEASFVAFDGFRRSETLASQSSKIKATKQTKAQQQESMSFNAINLYFSMKSLQSNIEAKKQKQKQFKYELTRLERFFKGGSVTIEKVEQVRAALAMTSYEISFLQQNFEDLALRMESLTGTAVTTVGNASFIDKTIESKEQSHEIKALEYEVKALNHEAKAKTAAYWPTIVIKDVVAGSQFYENESSSSGDPQTDAIVAAMGDSFAMATFSNKLQVAASITVWDFFAKSKERQAVQLQKSAKQSELDFKKRDTLLKQKFANIQLKTVKAKIASSKQNVEASKKNYEFISKQQEVNLVNSSTYLDATTQYYNAKAMLSAAQNEYQIALANYYFTNAIPLMEMIK